MNKSGMLLATDHAVSYVKKSQCPKVENHHEVHDVECECDEGKEHHGK